MDASAHGGKERKFCYHVKAPTEDKFDTMNLNVKIDTSWVFQDAEDTDNAHSGLSEGAKSSEEDAGSLKKQLETSEQKLRTAVEKHVRSESRLRNRIEELELSEQKLLQRVSHLNAQVYQEENAYLQAKEKLEEIQEELTDLVEETERARRAQREKLQQFQEQLHRKDEEVQNLLASFEHYKQNQRQQMAMVREQEGFLKGQVLRLEEEAQRLREATVSLMTELEAGGSQDWDAQSELPLEKCRVEPWYIGEDLTELWAFLEAGECQARRQLAALQQSLMALLAKEESNNQEKEKILRQLQEHRDTVLHLVMNKLEDFQGLGPEWPKEEPADGLQAELGAEAISESRPGTPPKKGAYVSKPSFVQDELLPLKWEAALNPNRNKACQTSFVIETAEGPGPVAGLPEEQDCNWGSFGGMKGSAALMPTGDNLDELLEEVRISDSEQDCLGVTSDPQTVLFLFCGPSSGQFNDDHLFPFNQLSFSRATPEPQNKESFSLSEKSVIPLLMPMVVPPVAGSLTVLEDSFPEELPQSYMTPGTQVPQVPKEPKWRPDEIQSSMNNPQPLFKKGIFRKYTGLPEETLDKREGALELELEEKQRTWLKSQDIFLQNGRNKKENFSGGFSDSNILTNGTKYSKGMEEEERNCFQKTSCCPEQRQKIQISVIQNEGDTYGKRLDFQEGEMKGKSNVWALQKQTQEKSQAGGSAEECGNLTVIVGRNQGYLPKDVHILEEKEKSKANEEKQIEFQNIHAWEEKDKLSGVEKKKGISHEEIVDLGSESHGQCIQKRPEFENEKFFSEELRCSEFRTKSPLLDESCENEILATDIENSSYFLKINELEKEIVNVFQEIFVLEEENESYQQKMKQLEEENWRYSQQLQFLQVEVKVDAHTASADADGKTDVDSSQQLEGGTEYDMIESVKLTKGIDIRTIFVPGKKNENHSKKLPHLKEIIIPNSQLAIWATELNRFPLKTEARESMKNRFFQLISDLQKEQNQVFLEITKLHRTQEMCNQKAYALEEEKERNLKRIDEFEKDKLNLLESITQLRSEQDKYLQLISDLEDCNGENYNEISDLQEENIALKKKLDNLQKTMVDDILEAQEVTRQVTQENQELKTLITDLSFGYKDLVKDLLPGIQDMMKTLKEENEQLLHKIRVMEGKATWETKDIEKISKENEQLKEQIQELLDKTNMVDEGIQVTDFLGQLARDEGLSLEEASVFAKGQKQHPICSDMHRLHVDYKRLNPFLMKEKPEVSTVTQDPSNEWEKKKVDFDKKKKRKSLLEIHKAHESLANSSQLQDIEHIPAEEEPKSSSKLLHHQIEELKRWKNEVNLAVIPLKAKVASLVQKCRDRNNLVMQLVQELHRHGIENLQLSQTARALVDDVAVASCAAAFVSSDPREACYQSDTKPENTAFGNDQTCLLSPDMNNHLSGYFSSNTSPAADSDPSLRKTHTGSPKLLSGVMDNPRTCQIGVDVGAGLISESSQQETQETCSLSTPPVGDFPLPLKVTSPERILALHWELSHSRDNNYQILPAPSESALSGSSTQPAPVEPSQPTAPCFPEPLGGSSFEEHQWQKRAYKWSDPSWSQTENQHSETERWGRSPRNTIMNNAWTSGDQPDGSPSMTTAENHLSNGLSVSNKGLAPLGEDSDVLERARSLTIKQEAPAPVGSLCIIKIVGQKCLMIGWEKPLVDELGRSNGTFVAGYRIYIDGEFHKYLVSSAWTKTLLENLDLSVPFSISVQTVGTGGLVSEKVHIEFNHHANKGTSSSECTLSPDEHARDGRSAEERRWHINKAHNLRAIGILPAEAAAPMRRDWEQTNALRSSPKVLATNHPSCHCCSLLCFNAFSEFSQNSNQRNKKVHAGFFLPSFLLQSH
ncbi:uncharacterized protein C4orf50 homolog isoform X2 [Sarcophilus harrisii]|uniref:uncharacterized protein C4orf50 homolog isoform X2 n=1 Tax=Sarcophilus harrisii TaxID=9305 RepID=UPI001301BE9F|nr:uncharacterized protein C4orf50 homolog isoform X2 [Sarcophilus harrisii]